MPDDSNFFVSLTDSAKAQIDDKSDRKKAKKQISKSLSKLFKRCSDNLDSYSLYEKMFDILSYYEKKQFKKKKLERSEFISIAKNQTTYTDKLVKSIIDLSKKDNDANNVSWNEIKSEYEEYFQETKDSNTKTDTLEISKKNFKLYNIKENNTKNNQTTTTTKKSSSNTTNKNETRELQEYAFNILRNIFNGASIQLKEQKENNGIYTKGYDAVKSLTKMGINQKEAEKAVLKQKNILNRLARALSTRNEKAFEKAYYECMGVKFDAEKISEYRIEETKLQIAQSGLMTTNAYYEDMISYSFGYPKELLDTYTEFFGGGAQGLKKAKKELENIILMSYKKPGGNTLPFSDVEGIEITDDNEVVYKDASNKEIARRNLDQLMSSEMDYIRRKPYEQDLQDRFLKKYAKAAGESYEKTLAQCKKLGKIAFGKGNEIQNIVDKYCTDQQSFLNKIGNIIQIEGMILMAAGAGLTLTGVGSGAGGALITAGSYVSLMGTFGDNVLKAIDTISSNNKWDKNRWMNILQETATDTAFFAIGRATGNISQGAGNLILNKTGNKFVSMAAKIGTDATIGMITSGLITGDLNLGGEALSQMLSLLVGISSTKIRKTNITASKSNTKVNTDVNTKVNKKSIKYKASGVKEALVSNAIKAKAKIKDVLKLQKLGLSDENTNKILADYSIQEAIDLSKTKIGKKSILAALSKGITAKDIKKYKKAGIEKKYIKDALKNKKQFSLCEMPHLKSNYELINELYHGKRIDPNLDNWNIKIGNRKIKIRTDNNLYTESYAKKHGIPKNGRPISDSYILAAQEALMQMQKMGQDIPDEIYLTDVFAYDKRISGEAAGYFTTNYKDSIFLNTSTLSSPEYFKKSIYHESTHMKDYLLGLSMGTDEFYSNFIIKNMVNTNKNTIEFTVDNVKYSIPISKINELFGNYSLTNNQEFIAELTTLVTSGTIAQQNGIYTILNNHYGTGYITPRETLAKFDLSDTKTLNDIMMLYNILTNGQIAKVKQL